MLGTSCTHHPKIATLMKLYLEQFNRKLLLPDLLVAGNLCYDDLPTLERFRNATIDKSAVCWAHVLGPCQKYSTTINIKQI